MAIHGASGLAGRCIMNVVSQFGGEDERAARQLIA
jgi:hypothetical protein